MNSAQVLNISALFLLSCGGGQLEPRYVAVHNTMSAMGLAQTGPISEGSLPEGAEARVGIQLQAGQCYTIVGLGSSGIVDLNLRVIAEGGEEVGHDATTDRQAVVQYCADRTGEYQVIVGANQGSGGYLVSSWSATGSAPGVNMNVAASGDRGSCGQPIALTLGQPMTGDTTGASNQTQGECAQGDAPERVYRLVVEERAQFSIALQSSFDGSLYVLRQCGDIQTMLDCNDDAGDTAHSQLNTTLDPGTYFVVVDGYGSASGAYELLVNTTTLRPVAEVCAAAGVLVPGQPTTGNTVGGADNFQPTCAGGPGSPDQVYRLDVPQHSRLRVRQNSDHDGSLYLRRTCEDATSEIACNDDFGDQRRSLITAQVTPGQYFVYSDGYGPNSAGNYTVTAELAPVQGGSATGDRCQAPAPFPSSNTVQIDTFEAADDLSGTCGGEGGADVVYALDVRSRSRLRASFQNLEFQGFVYVQRRCGDRDSEVACASLSTNQGAFDIVLQRGQYFLVVDAADPNTFGAADVNVELTDMQALERTCRRAPMLRPGRTVNGDTSSESDDFQGTCLGNGQSNDKVYRFRLSRRSNVRIDLSSSFDGALHLRRDCLDVSTELACNDDHEDARHSRIEQTLDRGTYYVVVDGFGNGSQGSFSLEFETSRP